MSETRIYRSIPRPDPRLLALLRGLGVADLHDEMAPAERKERLMSAGMRPMTGASSLVGPAVTAHNTPGDNLMMHTALFLAQAGDVLVLSNGGVVDGALWGANTTRQAQGKGVLGVVVDGPVRDTATCRELAFPVYATSISASKPTKQMPGLVNLPIQCGGVRVCPGDIIVADSDGVLVIPPAQAERLAAGARQRMERDEGRRASFARGETSFEQAGMDAALKKLGAVIEDGTWPG
jgi:4-hydroxy-4-methyl-2-oxoglutarate aldolase